MDVYIHTSIHSYIRPEALSNMKRSIMLLDPLTLREIAKLHGVTTRTVQNALVKLH